MSARRLLVCLALAALAGAAPAVRAVDLLATWHAAEEHDLEFAAARAAYAGGMARRDQAAALWRPTVELSGSAGRMNRSTAISDAQFYAPGLGQSRGVDFNTSIQDGNATSWSLTARQALLNGNRLAQSRQLDFSADLAQVQWQDARQGLMLRTAERYFEVAVAEEALRVLREQQDALERALTEAQERFRLGDTPVTDTHEAQARAQAARAQVLAAQTDLLIKRYALADITGIAQQDLHAQVPPQCTQMPAVAGLEHWLGAAADNNLSLREQAIARELALQDAARSTALAAPRLDLVARVGRDRLSGGGDFGAASNTANSGMVGLELTIPVFTGGYRSAQHAEAMSLAEKARLDERRVGQQAALQTRAAWLELTTGARRVDALRAALVASRARLDATHLGLEIGDRSTLDVLNAQADAASAELALLQARVGLLTQRLRLAALAGALDESQLQAINGGICANEPPQ